MMHLLKLHSISCPKNKNPPQVLFLPADNNAVREPVSLDKSGQAQTSEEAWRVQRPKQEGKRPENKQGQKAQSSMQTPSGGVRAWQTNKNEKQIQRNRKNPGPGNHAKHRNANQQKEPAPSLEKHKAEEERSAPEFDILESPPEKLRSGRSFI